MNPPILLDTCAVIWVMDNEAMSEKAVAAIDEAYDNNEKVFVSPITVWEIGLSAEKGRFKSTYSPHRWLELLLARPQIAIADLSPLILLESCGLPGKLNRDPADRIIAATARQYGYTVITRDRVLLDYGKQGYLNVLEC